jgi:hypothetical protein
MHSTLRILLVAVGISVALAGSLSEGNLEMKLAWDAAFVRFLADGSYEALYNSSFGEYPTELINDCVASNLDAYPYPVQ